MKREGRIHGCNVRLGKRTWGYGGHGGKGILPSKPTNASKNSMKHPIVPAVAHIVTNEHELPSQKSIGKTKSSFKAKDLDITRNHLMQDWRLYKLGFGVEENFDIDDAAYRRHGNKHGKRWTRDDYGGAAGGGYDDDDEGTDYEEEQQRQVEEEESRETSAGSRDLDRARTEIVLPIESLLIKRKRKIAPSKANAVDQKHPLAAGDSAGAEIVVLDEEAADVDEFESWWGLGFYDGEEVPDDWFLITEGEGFVAAA